MATTALSEHDRVIYKDVQPVKNRLYGRVEPRVWTPPLRELTPQTSLGFAAIIFAEDVLGIRPFPWQRWLLIHTLEIEGDLDGDWSFRFRNVVVLIARQNGKSTLSQILSLFFLYVLGTSLILGTAQDLDTAEEVWDGALDLIEGSDELRPLMDKPIRVNGKKTIRLLTGERYKVKAASRKAGRGLSGDLILLDELREHTTWEAWGAITKTTMARPNAQIWSLSNAGDAASVVLRYLRKMAHAALGDPDGIVANEDPTKLLDEELDESAAVEADDTLGLFEWSAPPDIDVRDRDGWAQANPSLGHGIQEKTLLSAAGTDPEWVFRTECLCQWSDGTLEGAFPAGTWEAGIDGACTCGDCERCTTMSESGRVYPGSQIAPGSKIGLCLDVSWNRTKAYIAASGLRTDGRLHVEIIATRAGTDWVVNWFTDPEHPERLTYDVAVQTSGPAGSLEDELLKARVRLIPWKGADLGQSCGRIYDLVKDKLLMHRPQPVLDVAAATAIAKPLGDAWVWDRKKSPVDCSPLMAATGAIWLVSPKPEEAPPSVHGWDEDEIAAWEKEAAEEMAQWEKEALQ